MVIKCNKHFLDIFYIAAIADENGKIEWYPTDDLRVLEVDSKNIKDILIDFKLLHSDLLEIQDKIDEYNNCPGCGYEINEEDKECPSCGLSFVIEE